MSAKTTEPVELARSTPTGEGSYQVWLAINVATQSEKAVLWAKAPAKRNTNLKLASHG